MAHTRPVPALGRARLNIVTVTTTGTANTVTSRGHLSADAATWNHSKAPDGSALSFTANHLEPDLAADGTLLEEAFAIVEVDVAGTFTARGTPYALAPGTGQVIGQAEGSAKEQSPVAVGALQALASECIVLPNECDDASPTMRYACGIDGNRYMGWQSKGYSESLHPTAWNNADVYTPSAGTLLASGAAVTASNDHVAITGHGLATGDRVRIVVVSGAAGLTDGAYDVTVVDANTITLDELNGDPADVTSDGTIDVYSGLGAKYAEPTNWDVNADAAAFVYRNAAEGGLTLFRIGTFTLSARTTVKFISSADEEHKVYLDGPNMGGVIIDGSGDETGYTEKNHWRRRLEPGTYRVSAEMTTVDSTGGDGNDSLRFACGTIDTKGNIATVLLKTDAATRVHRQNKNDERPGMSPMEVARRLLQDNADLGVTGASVLLADKDFTDALDSAGVAPTEADCREWVWPLGTSMASVLSDMSEDADFDLTTAFVFQCWGDRGTDRGSTPAVGATTVELTPGANPPTAAMNILDYSWDSDPAGPTRYLTESQDGYDIVVGTSAETGTRPRFGFFETGASASIARAKRNARSAIRQTGNGPRRYYTARVLPVTGAVPEADFTICDVVHGRGYRNLGLDVEVTDVGGDQDETGVEYTLALAVP